jgi:hypothetical protein
MSATRPTAPAFSAVALSLLLVACGQVSANPDATDAPVVSPPPTTSPKPKVTPKPAEPPAPPAPTPTPAPTPVAPSPVPSEPAGPTPITLIEHPVPMIGRAVVGGVNVRVRPSLSAPLLNGERYDDGETTVVPNIRLREGERVWVSMGPVYADGESWYEVGVYDGGGLYWGYGWVAGRFLAHDADIVGFDPVLAALHGVGTGGTVSVHVPEWSTPTVRYMATPVEGETRCAIAVSVTNTDGTVVAVDSRTITEATFLQVHAWELEGLQQGPAGTLTLAVETDCSFAAALFQPQG